MSIHFGNQLSQDLKDSIKYDTYEGFCAYHSMSQQEQTALRNRFAAKRYRKAKKLRIQELEAFMARLEKKHEELLQENVQLKRQLEQLQFDQQFKNGEFFS